MGLVGCAAFLFWKIIGWRSVTVTFSMASRREHSFARRGFSGACKPELSVELGGPYNFYAEFGGLMGS